MAVLRSMTLVAVRQAAGAASPQLYRCSHSRPARCCGGRPRFVSIPLALARAFAAIGERVASNPPLTTPILEVLEQDDRIDPSAACRALGIALTPLDDTLRRVVSNGGEGRSA